MFFKQHDDSEDDAIYGYYCDDIVAPEIMLFMFSEEDNIS